MSETRKADPYAVESSPGSAPASAPGSAPAAAAGSARFTDQLMGGVHVIEFSRSDVLDAHYIEQLGDDLYHHFKPIEKPKVVVDLARVTFLSSAALGMLIALRTVIGKQKGGLAISNVNPELMQVFKITKLHKLMGIHGSTDDAIRSLL